MLGADTRATEDTVVADKNCSKIHYMAPNIYCCGAGQSTGGRLLLHMSIHQWIRSLDRIPCAVPHGEYGSDCNLPANIRVTNTVNPNILATSK